MLHVLHVLKKLEDFASILHSACLKRQVLKHARGLQHRSALHLGVGENTNPKTPRFNNSTQTPKGMLIKQFLFGPSISHRVDLMTWLLCAPIAAGICFCHFPPAIDPLSLQYQKLEYILNDT